MTFGADTFGADSGSDFQAIEQLVSRLEPYPNATIHLYHESGRTFHPKIYLLDHAANEKALMVVGSSNWSYGGLAGNIEANILIHLSLNIEEEREIYDRLSYCFANYGLFIKCLAREERSKVLFVLCESRVILLTHAHVHETLWIRRIQSACSRAGR